MSSYVCPANVAADGVQRVLFVLLEVVLVSCSARVCGVAPGQSNGPHLPCYKKQRTHTYPSVGTMNAGGNFVKNNH